MVNSFQLVPLSEVLSQYVEYIEAPEPKLYPKLSVKLYGKGVILDGFANGARLKMKRHQIAKAGQVILSEIWGKKGAIGFVPTEGNGALCTSHFFLFDIRLNKILPKYLQVIFESNYLQPQLENSAKGTTGYAAVRPKHLLFARIPLPNLETQLKITSKIDSVEKEMKVMKQLNSENKECARELRQSILQKAVSGKLVPQDPNDQPASELLKIIEPEKERLFREKSIKKEKPLPKIKSEEIPFELPKSWTWARLGYLGETQTGTTPSTDKSEYFGGNIPFIKPADVTGKTIDYNNESLSSEGLRRGRLIPKDSLMMVCIGGSTGKSYFTDRDCSCNQQINTVKGLCGITGKFLHYFTSSPFFQETVWSQSTGSATNIINKQKWASILFPLPPLKEQRRIVEKIETLMKYCDELEEKVKENQNSLELLMEAVLKESF